MRVSITQRPIVLFMLLMITHHGRTHFHMPVDAKTTEKKSAIAGFLFYILLKTIRVAH